MDRKRFLFGLFSALSFFLPIAFISSLRKSRASRYFLRPPGALPETEFKKQCIGCFKCATACPNNCIEMAGSEYGLENIFTPVIIPRKKGCIQCMRCTEVCPTGALTEIPNHPEMILSKVKMGVATVDENLCFSYFGRTCGVCYRACPYPGKAMTVGLYERPKINPEMCTGCGLCEQACIHMPQAVRVRPLREDAI